MDLLANHKRLNGKEHENEDSRLSYVTGAFRWLKNA